MFWCAAVRMSELELEQRTNIKFLVTLGKSGNEIREMLVQVYWDNVMKKMQNAPKHYNVVYTSKIVTSQIINPHHLLLLL
jgi:hypothetical protein